MAEAIDRWVGDDASVVMGCGLESAIPFAAGHELIRQGRRGLTLIGPISDMLFDLLVGSGCARKVVAAWVGNVGDGLGHNFRRAVEQGIPQRVEVDDHSNLTLALGLQAAAWGVPYLPTLTVLGSSLLTSNPGLRPLTCPFTGQNLVAVQAIRPDVAIVHAQRADAEGNTHLWGNLGVTVEAVRAARCVIVSCEEVVPPEVIRSDPNRTLIPGFLVSAVVAEPWGAHPSPLQGYARRDDAFYVDYHAHSRSRAGFEAWLRTWVLDVRDRREYLARLGEDRLRRLQITRAALAAPVDYGWS
ncbi:MAG: CoA-transferase [Armatimonadota bacterium]|nr:CoA-transferase [Armatimonadota bacterium]MDR7463070.1 CoA-transferase [Armatimonadota bacterium]MDR7469347.1 CoA-transferase [Armatimonadota bacterium]